MDDDLEVEFEDFGVDPPRSGRPGNGSSNRTLAAGCSTIRPSRSGPAKVTRTMRRLG